MEHEYIPRDWDVDALAHALDEGTGCFPVPDHTDPIWREIPRHEMTAIPAARLLQEAEVLMDSPPPALPASLFIDFSRTGNRRNYQEPFLERRRRVGLFALAELMEGEGRFLDAVLDYAWAICEQSSWLFPAHYRSDSLPRVIPPRAEEIALRSAENAIGLAEIDYLLGDRLHPALRERIGHEVERRVLSPYEAREDFVWLTKTNNWNAVCNGGTAGGALYLLEDSRRVARIVLKAVSSLRHFFDGFDEDGCCPEGVGYWNFGVGQFAIFADLLETRTAGKFSLFDAVPLLERIAAFPLKVELSPGRYVPFSDTGEDRIPEAFVCCRLGERFALPALVDLGLRQAQRPAEPKFFHDWLRSFLWPLAVLRSGQRSSAASAVARSSAPPPVAPPRRVLFRGAGWWLARVDETDSDTLVVAAKNGHNGEPHNHNDCGTFVLHFRGESLLTDLGAPVYDRDFFGPRRYEYLAARSLGHSVPYVNGVEQAPGSDYAAQVLEVTPEELWEPRHTQAGGDQGEEDSQVDVFALELSGCYPVEAGLSSLRRCYTLERPANPAAAGDRSSVVRQAREPAESAGRLIVEDTATFRSDAPGTYYQSVLISYAPLEVADGGLLVHGERSRLRVILEPAARVSIEHLRQGVRDQDVWRALIGLVGNSGESRVTLRMVMVPDLEGPDSARTPSSASL